MPPFKNNWTNNPWDSFSVTQEELPIAKNMWDKGTPEYDKWFDDENGYANSESLKSETMIGITKHHRAFLKEIGIRLYQFCRFEFTAIGEFGNVHYETNKNAWSIYGSKFILTLSAIEGGYNNWVGSPAQKANNFLGIGGAYTNSQGESTFKTFQNFNACMTYWIIMFDARNWETAFVLLENANSFTDDSMNNALNSYTYFQNPNPPGEYSYNIDPDTNEPSGRLNYAKKIRKAMAGVLSRFVTILKEEISILENKLLKEPTIEEALSNDIPLIGVMEYADGISLSEEMNILKNILKEVQ